MLSTAGLLIAFAAAVSAWMPGEREMATASGKNAFKTSTTMGSGGSARERRWLPGTLPVRGVNLGSMFVVEPWMASTEWSNVLHCGSTGSEFDCVSMLGQSTANANWKNHWSTWITQQDIQTMASYSLNTIRIPVGYWIFEDLKYPSEHFPEGGLSYLEQICGWAADEGLYVVIDLHGAPFGQTASNADTGQLAAPISDSNPAFYQSSQFDRALQFLGNMTQLIHQNTGATGSMRNVGMLEVLNEPEQSISPDLLTEMRQNYYPAAFSTIRGVETQMGVSPNNQLHIQMMNEKWGAGDPTQYLTENYFAAYDDHRYLKYDPSVTQTQQGYISASCKDDRGGNTPTIVGEWSLSISTANQNNAEFWPVTGANLHFYQNWFAAQVQAYEKPDVDGWIFWAWKTELGDDRWSYSDAVKDGVIPKDLSTIAGMKPCS